MSDLDLRNSELLAPFLN